MAALQGHLMRYKTRPHHAVAETQAWVELERKHKRDWEGQTEQVQGENKLDIPSASV